MASVASSQSDKTTYAGRMLEATQLNTSLQQSCFIDLSKRVNITVETIQTEAATLFATDQAENLQKFLSKKYENYDTIVKGHKIAIETLHKLREIYAICTPANVALTNKQLTHMEKLGYDVSEYAQKEVKLAGLSVELGTIITNLDALAEKTKAYIDAYPSALNVAARHQRQMTRDPTWGDKLPDTLGGAEGYFLKGLEQFHRISNPESSASATTTSASPTDGET